MRSRDLVWDGCVNVRDLGGHPTEDGGETRFGAVIRADSVGLLSDEGWATLIDTGVARIVDLRLEMELDADPPRDLRVEVVHVPILDRFDDETWAEVEERSMRAADDTESTRIVYLQMLQHCRDRFAEAVTAVADAPPGPVVVHCHGGKDRTGLVVALLLRLADVPIEDVAQDYALSAERLRERTERWLAGAEDEAERERIRRVTSCPAPGMQHVLEALDERYGNVATYLLDAGIPPDALGRVRSRLRA
jgi:protein tyrosine/serine phosphatase